MPGMPGMPGQGAGMPGMQYGRGAGMPGMPGQGAGMPGMPGQGAGMPGMGGGYRAMELGNMFNQLGGGPDPNQGIGVPLPGWAQQGGRRPWDDMAMPDIGGAGGYPGPMIQQRPIGALDWAQMGAGAATDIANWWESKQERDAREREFALSREDETRRLRNRGQAWAAATRT
jgi:hypothetical protein